MPGPLQIADSSESWVASQFEYWRDQAESGGMIWDKTSTALSVDSHVLEGDDRLIGVCWPTEKNRVFFVAEVPPVG